jgi:WD40 repeat protein
MSFFLGSKTKSPSQGNTPDQNTQPGLAGPAIKLEDHTNTVFCCAFSDHASSADVDLATASYDGTTRIWDVSKSLSGSKKASCKSVPFIKFQAIDLHARHVANQLLEQGCFER